MVKTCICGELQKDFSKVGGERTAKGGIQCSAKEMVLSAQTFLLVRENNLSSCSGSLCNNPEWIGVVARPGSPIAAAGVLVLASARATGLVAQWQFSASEWKVMQFGAKDLNSSYTRMGQNSQCLNSKDIES